MYVIFQFFFGMNLCKNPKSMVSKLDSVILLEKSGGEFHPQSLSILHPYPYTRINIRRIFISLYHFWVVVYSKNILLQPHVTFRFKSPVLFFTMHFPFILKYMRKNVLRARNNTQCLCVFRMVKKKTRKIQFRLSV